MDGKIHERQLWQMYGRWARWMVRNRGWMDGCEIEGSIDMQMDRRIDGETVVGSEHPLEDVGFDVKAKDPLCQPVGK